MLPPDKKRTKSLSPERAAAVRRFLDRIVREEFGGNGKAAAVAIGISQSLVSGAQTEARGLGMMTIERLADYAGVSVDEVVGRESAPRSARGVVDRPELTRFRDLPGWREADIEARARYGDRVPAYAFHMAGEMTSPLPPEHVDAFVVRDYAETWLRNAPELLRIESFMRGLNAEIARNEAAAKSQSTSDQPAAVGPENDAAIDVRRPPG